MSDTCGNIPNDWRKLFDQHPLKTNMPYYRHQKQPILTWTTYPGTTMDNGYIWLKFVIKDDDSLVLIEAKQHCSLQKEYMLDKKMIQQYGEDWDRIYPYTHESWTYYDDMIMEVIDKSKFVDYVVTNMSQLKQMTKYNYKQETDDGEYILYSPK
jgi:hypothetical protein